MTTTSVLNQARQIVKTTLEKRLKANGFKKTQGLWRHSHPGLPSVEVQWSGWNSHSGGPAMFRVEVHPYCVGQFFFSGDDLPQVHHFINSGIHSVAEQVLGRLGLFELYQGKIRELPEAYSLTYDKSLSERGDLGARARVIKGCLSGIKREYRYRWGDPAALSAELDALTDAIGDLVSNGIRPVAVARLREVAGQPE